MEGIGADGEITQEARRSVENLLHTAFRPESLNRLDEIVFYKPLTKADITKIVDLLLADLNRRLAAKQITCTLSPEAKEYIIEQGYDPLFGARPLRRYLQHHVETLIGRKIIAENLPEGTNLVIGLSGDALTVSLK
jgi:ATP-dependent Clp protease ATP-binding subunit ClpB